MAQYATYRLVCTVLRRASRRARTLTGVEALFDLGLQVAIATPGLVTKAYTVGLVLSLLGSNDGAQKRGQETDAVSGQVQ